MLVLTRRCDQKILIGSDVVVTIVEIRPGYSVRIGIDAPPDIPIRRDDVKCWDVKPNEERWNVE